MACSIVTVLRAGGDMSAYVVNATGKVDISFLLFGCNNIEVAMERVGGGAVSITKAWSDVGINLTQKITRPTTSIGLVCGTNIGVDMLVLYVSEGYLMTVDSGYLVVKEN